MGDGPAPRIALFASHLRTGGAEAVLVNLAAGLRARGAEVEVVLVAADGAMQARLPPGARVVILGGRTATAIPHLARYLTCSRPAALISFLEHANVAAVIARRLAPSWRGRLVVTEHAQFAAHSRRAVSVGHRASLLLAPYAYRDADILVGVSRGMADEWRRRLAGSRVRCVAIHNPVVDDGFPGRAAAAAPHPWFAEGDPPLVAVGRLSPEKDHTTLIAAMAKPELARLRLVIIGDGPERAALERQVCESGQSDRIAFTGMLADPLPAMARAALLVHTSRYEGFGNVLVEALACGTPVVATDCPFGPAEILAGGRHGVLVPCGEPDSLTRGIVTALAQPFDRAALRARAQDFHLHTVAGRYLDALGLATCMNRSQTGA